MSRADRDTEALIRRELEAAFPGDAYLGEEGGGSEAERLWVIDPIDGTLNFVHGVRYWCVSIVFILEGRRRIGVVYDPPHDELFFATEGAGALLTERPTKAELERSLADLLRSTGRLDRLWVTERAG